MYLIEVQLIRNSCGLCPVLSACLLLCSSRHPSVPLSSSLRPVCPSCLTFSLLFLLNASCLEGPKSFREMFYILQSACGRNCSSEGISLLTSTTALCCILSTSFLFLCFSFSLSFLLTPIVHCPCASQWCC